MPAANLVIVESPAKAKTINKYLGKDFKVVASMGHVRDLSPKSGSVRPEENFAMSWLVSGRGEKQISDIANYITDQTTIYLATDPDREGEAISWHLQEELTRRKKLGAQPPKRIVFHEITEQAITAAMKEARAIDNNLVSAYLARRALDYLVGYSLSPILWRKLPGTKSAGRVQSVALRLIVEREMEIKNFQSTEYWSVAAALRAMGAHDNNPTVLLNALLTHENGKRLDRLAIGTETKATDYQRRIEQSIITLDKVDMRQVKRHPAAPFTTSTLQQEASRKLGFGSSRTMQVAQQLYEGGSLGGDGGGLITYMRTDSTTLSGQAIAAARSYIEKNYSRDYLPDQPRQYKTKSKNAQEAHEAIRPTNINQTPDRVASFLKPEQLGLYKLIWQRTVASQMESALFNQTTASFGCAAGQQKNSLTLTANGQTVIFDGFLKLYQEGKDDEEDEESRTIPALKADSGAKLDKVTLNQHFTDPPPRYSEASLVKKMEEIGIGRPSTYANIIRVIQDREYVRVEKRRFFCENRGIILSAFLTRYYDRYFNYAFTAKMEDELDDVSNGEDNWQELLRRFWDDFSKKLGEGQELLHQNIQQELQTVLGDFIFGVGEDRAGKEKCQKCKDGHLTLQLGTYGPYLSCSNYPHCDYRAAFDRLGNSDGLADDDGGMILPKLLGQNETGHDILLKKGPYGFYVEQALTSRLDNPATDNITAVDETTGEVTMESQETSNKADTDKEGTSQNPTAKTKKDKRTKKAKDEKPKRSALPKNYEPLDVTLPLAIKLLTLPRTIGVDPNSGETIIGSIGPYGPYLKMGATYYSLKGDDNVLELGLNRALDIIANAPKKRNEARLLGTHPDGGEVVIKRGRWGYYLEWMKPTKAGKTQKKFAKLPAGTDGKGFTLDMGLVAFPAARESAKAGKKSGEKSAKKSGGKSGGKSSKGKKKNSNGLADSVATQGDEAQGTKSPETDS